MADDKANSEDPGAGIPDGEIFFLGEREGHRMRTFRYDGMYLFPVRESMLKGEKQIDKLRKLKETNLDDNDVIICAYPKCGTHWSWEILEMLKSGVIKHQKEVKETRMMEFIFKEGIEAIPTPRILNTHLPLRMLPKEVEEKKIKCIHIMRNPKDTCVSMYNHAKNANRADSEEFADTFSEFTDRFLAGKVAYGAYHQYLLTWDEEAAKMKDIPTLSLYYEDMKRDPVTHTKIIAQFLGLTVTDKFCEDVADACSFQNMKKADEAKEGRLFEYWKKGSGGTFYRKGETGDWKNWFTVAESERFDQIWNEKMKNSGITFTYSLK